MVLIITMIILSVLAATILPTLFTTEMGQVSASGAMRAYYLAEAGGRYALPRLGTIAVGTHTFKFSGGDTFFKIEKLSGAQFTSTGVVSEGTGLESRVTITYNVSGSLFDYGLFSDGGLTFTDNSIVDSYSSSGQPTDGENGNVGTNGDTITVVGSNVHIHGDQELSVGKDMTPEPLPAGASSWTDITSQVNMSGNETGTLSGGEYSATSIDISNNAVLTITGDVVMYVTGITELSDNARVNIAAGASLTIYAAGDIAFSVNAIGNSSEVPADFIIYGIAGCDNISLINNTNLHAAIYAPGAEVAIRDNAIVYGAIAGDTITMHNNARIHYDEDLQGVGGGGSGSGVEQYFTEN